MQAHWFSLWCMVARKGLFSRLHLPLHWFLQIFPLVPARNRLVALYALQYQAMCNVAIEPQLQLRHTERVIRTLWVCRGPLTTHHVDDVFDRQCGGHQAELQVSGAEEGKCVLYPVHFVFFLMIRLLQLSHLPFRNDIFPFYFNVL